jgi:Uma2 family endonuclease
MGTVTTLPRGMAFTRQDLDSMPDDGRRYEIIDGTLLVTPAPSLRHQWVSSSLIRLLQAAAPPELKILHAPTDVILDDLNALQPDLLVVRADEIEHPDKPLRPLLVVEILSPSTRRVDLTLKRSRYETAACPSYWVVDPDEPSVTTWELVDGLYAEAGHATGEETLEVMSPFPLSLIPARLLD